ncbi:MAG: hypothetical protein ACJ0RC_05760 [Alphaproteobacteria bacterium]
MKKNYSGVMAMKEHILKGNKISNLEALLLFGVQNLQNEMRLMKNEKYFIKSQKVSMVKILKRINKYVSCKAPENLPTTDILSIEYWVSK